MQTILTPGKASKLTAGLNIVAAADLPCELQEPRLHVTKANAANGDFDSFPIRQLLRFAHQSGIAEPLACASSLTILKTSRAVHRCLLNVLKPLGLSEGRFCALVTLYALDPMPSNSADLAYHTEITRPAMTGLLDAMVKRGWVRRRHRPNKDRRFSWVSLTKKGREVTRFAIYQFLKSAAEISEDLQPEQHELLDRFCIHMRRRSLKLMS